MKKQIFVLLLIFSALQAFPQIQWQRCYGGSNQDGASSIQTTFDGGYIFAGSTNSNDGDITATHGGFDYWVVKISSFGSIQWQKSYGGTNDEGPTSIRQTTDSGYIIAGSSLSNDGDVTSHHGDNAHTDYWIVKLSPSGTIQWQKSLGGSGNEVANDVRQTSDGGYVVAGYSDSHDGDVTGNHGSYDYWITKLSSSGNIQWQKSLGSSGDDEAYSIMQTYDGGYIIAGYADSNNGDVTGNHGLSDCWIVKLSASGNILWQRSLGGSNTDFAKSIDITSDSGFIIVGNSNSIYGDVTGHHGSFSGYDYWIIKLSSSGALQWERTYGGTNDDKASSIENTSDSGFIIVGNTFSNDGDVTGNHSFTGAESDIWIVKLFASGNLQWEKCIGGSLSDGVGSIIQTSDGGYIVVGGTYSNDGDVTGNHGNDDVWVVKLGSKTSIENVANTMPISVVPNPTTGSLIVKGVGMVNIRIYNAMGQLIKEANNTNNISISDCQSGMYFIRLFNTEGLPIYQAKIIKD